MPAKSIFPLGPVETKMSVSFLHQKQIYLGKSKFFDLQKIFQEHPDLSPADTAPFVAELWEKYGIEM